KGDDPIDAINHMMPFLTTVVTSRYPPTNNQLKNPSNPRQQATINNGRATIQPIQGRQNSLAAGTSRPYTSGSSGNNSGKQRTVVCYNYKGEGHINNSFSQQSVPNFDQLFEINELKAQSQEKDTEKVLVITALKDTLRKLKGKAVVDEAVTLHPFDLELLKIDVAH
nr:hypothetical protein [Tanacetum cinerariifolium]